jgi:hypothetical protein
VYGSGSPSASSAPAGIDSASARTQRYNYLVGRLRNRQITMEEATELFTTMQTMLARANDLARAAASRAPATPAPLGGPLAPPPPAPGGGASADDLLLVGILAMGAGAGLMAALARRMGDPTPPNPSGSGRSKPNGASH